MQNKKRIAFIVNGGVYSGFNSEGMPVMTQLITGLSERCDVIVYSFTEINQSKAPFKAIRVNGGKITKYLNVIRHLKKDHKESSFSLIHGFFGLPSGFLTVCIAKLLKLPSVVTLMGGESANVPDIGFGALRNWHTKKIVFWMIKNATKVVAQTNYQWQMLKKNGLNSSIELAVIPFGIKVEGLGKVKTPERGYFQLISIGNINMIKDHFTMVKSLKKLRNSVHARLAIVGGDYLNGRVQAFVNEQGMDEHVDFLGHLSNKEAVDELSRSNVLVITSKSEGMSVVFLEAMMKGVPVCSTPVGLMHDVEGSHCLVSDIGDYSGMAENLKIVLANQEFRSEIIEKGFNWVRENDLSVTIDRYSRVYEEVQQNGVN